MARTKTIALNEGEKERLNAARNELFGTSEVPYGVVISRLVDSITDDTTAHHAIEHNTERESDVGHDTDDQSSVTDNTENQSDVAQDTGSQRYSEADFIAAIKNNDRPSNTEVAEIVGCSKQACGYRLNQLEDEGKISSEKDGRSKRWMLSAVRKID